MKRSEMIEIIADALLTLYGGAPDEYEEVRQDTLMARLKTAHISLKAVEENGMEPPFTDGSTYWNEWEPENEKA